MILVFRLFEVSPGRVSQNRRSIQPGICRITRSIRPQRRISSLRTGAYFRSWGPPDGATGGAAAEVNMLRSAALFRLIQITACLNGTCA
jgi:hypothetical protein